MGKLKAADMPTLEASGNLVASQKYKNITYITQEQAQALMDSANEEQQNYTLKFFNEKVSLCETGKKRAKANLCYDNIVQIGRLKQDSRSCLLHHKKGKTSMLYIFHLDVIDRLAKIERTVELKNKNTLSWSTSVDEVYEMKRLKDSRASYGRKLDLNVTRLNVQQLW